MRVRTPAVAGMFYPSEKDELIQSIKSSIYNEYGVGKTKLSKKIFGAICPHAGYMYSGPIATHSFEAISEQDFEVAIILGPNHWGLGCQVATMKDAVWASPLGNVEVDSDAAEKINKLSRIIEIDFFSHTREHSIEVQVPMLQYYKSKFTILPICILNQDYEFALEVGRAVANIAKEKKAVIIGSSDFTHYEQNEIAHRQDKALIEPILEMDVERFYDVLENRRVSACGYGAIAATMVACKELGAREAMLLKYATSGDVAGSKDSVVGYASIVFS
ncbi:MAG: MEMO1 family protein [Candidatus Nitrosotenuis sp.]|uniref:MEMO1 family protein NUZ5A_50217 n=1 Tax=Candidatus Nitrosotenuis uzonensis TaxID=1407055 RepID=A0A812EYQ5_9ARCH|nr:MEMO1 family protein [Candidatus Nitrosotenuis uzonensis]CAE6493829.1 MEMO1 family protein Nmar_0215 [Candidatus Nitrosotenuis uzonensis]